MNKDRICAQPEKTSIREKIFAIAFLAPGLLGFYIAIIGAVENNWAKIIGGSVVIVADIAAVAFKGDLAKPNGK